MNGLSASGDYPDLLRVPPAGGPVSGVISIPGSKSVGNRAILLAACAEGATALRGLLDSDDTDAALRALRALGVPFRRDGDRLDVSGTGLYFANRRADVDVGASGTVGRFLPGLLAASPGGDWRLVAAAQLASRPLKPLADALGRWGARLDFPLAGASFPLNVSGGGLSGGGTDISAAASSQFVSGLLLAAPLCRRPAVVTVRDLDPEETYVDITLDLMRRFGATAVRSRAGGVETIVVDPQPYRPVDMAIEADANTACYFFALAALTGGEIAVDNLHAASRQPGVKFLDVFSRLGCGVVRGEAVSVSGSPPFRGGFSIDMRAMSEMALTLGVMAVFADAPITMTNLAHIRGHESDRIAALVSILRRLGVEAAETADSVTVHPRPAGELADVVVDPFDDHRVAMSVAVLGAAANGVSIRNPGCVRKTCPGFFAMLTRLGVAASP